VRLDLTDNDARAADEVQLVFKFHAAFMYRTIRTRSLRTLDCAFQRSGALVAVVALWLAACGSPQSSLAELRPRIVTPEELQEEVALPVTPAGQVLGRVLDALNGSAAELDEAFFQELFTPAFIAEVGLVTLGTTFTQPSVGLQPPT